MAPERWLELTVSSPLEADLVSPVLLEFGGTAVEESKKGLVIYLPAPSDPEIALDNVRRRLQESFPSTPFDLGWRWQSHEDWKVLWRRGLGVRRITSRLRVAPSWEKVEVEPGGIVLTIDPGMAFGTAEHATTRGCLRMLDSKVRTGSRIADVGAGSGILSIAAAHLGAGEVLAMEMDGMSCETAAENIVDNGVEDRVQVRQVQVDGSSPLPGAPYDGIVANLQSHLLAPLLSSLRGSLVPGGWLITSGILLEEKAWVLSAAAGDGFVFLEDDEEDGWWTGVFEPGSIPG